MDIYNLRIRAHDELTLFGHCCPYCDCGGGREKEGKYITAVPAGVINNQCNPMLIATPGRAVSLCQWARQKTVYVTTVYASQTYRTSRNRSNRMWISKQSNWKGKPRRESGFRAITISRAASLLTKTALDLDILMSQTWSWHLDRWRCPLVCRYLSRNRFLGSSSKLLEASVGWLPGKQQQSMSPPALYQLPIWTFIFPVSTIFSEKGFSGQGVGGAAQHQHLPE